MAAPDYEHYEGFDKYGPVGQDLLQPLNSRLWADEWTTVSGGNSVRIVAPLTGVVTGHGGCRLQASGSGNTASVMIKNVPGNYARVVGGFTTQSPDAFSNGGMIFKDSVTDQLSIILNNTTGHIEVRRGSFGATLLATSTETIATGTTHVIEYDITFHGSAGKVKVWLDGIATSIALTGTNTIVSANAYVNRYGPATQGSNTHAFIVDHMYHWFYTASGGTELPCLDNPIIETSVASADDAVAWSINGHAFATPFYYWGLNATNYTPVLNSIYLRPVVADQSGTISNLILPRPLTTSAVSKQKAVIYADSAGAPGALLATGTEVVGVTSGTALVLPVALAGVVAGTTYWVGLITDTSILYVCNEETAAGYTKANTYTSGPPSPAGAGFTTTRNNINMVITMTGVATHFPQVSAAASLGDWSYNYSSTLNQQDMFSFPALSSAPLVIHGVAVKGQVARSDSGVRGLRFVAKSSGAATYGSSGDISPPTSYGMEGSYYRVDPNTGAAWGAGALAAAKFGVEVTL